MTWPLTQLWLLFASWLTFIKSTIPNLIVLVTNFSIVIGHPRAYFLRVSCVVTWVLNYSHPISLSVIGHLRCARVNQLDLNGFFFCCFPPTFKLIENNLAFWVQKRPHRLFNLELWCECDQLVIRLSGVQFRGNLARYFKSSASRVICFVIIFLTNWRRIYIETKRRSPQFKYGDVYT